MLVSNFLRFHVIVSLVDATSQSQAKSSSSTISPDIITTTTFRNANLIITTTTTAKPDRFINLSALSALTSFTREPEVKERTKNTCRSTDICATMQGICNNGKCVPMPCSEFECQCEQGYVGQFCDREANAKKTSNPEPPAAGPATHGTSHHVNTHGKNNVNGKNAINREGTVVSNEIKKTNVAATSKPKNDDKTTSTEQEAKKLIQRKTAEMHVSKDVTSFITISQVTDTILDSKKGSQASVVSDTTSIKDHAKSSDVKEIKHGQVSGPNARESRTSINTTQGIANAKVMTEKHNAISTTTELPKGSFRKGKEAVVLVDKTAVYIKNTSEILKAGPTTVVTETKAVVLIEKESWQSRIFGIPPKGMSPAIKSGMPERLKRTAETKRYRMN